MTTPNRYNVTPVTDGDAIATWAHTGSAIDADTAANMTVVDASFGRTATTRPDDAPWTGIGRGHARPFIGRHPITCSACNVYMTADAFPTRSVPLANPPADDPNRGTRGHRCRACNRAGIRTMAAYVAVGSPDRARWVADPTATYDPATGAVIVPDVPVRRTRARRSDSA